MEARGLDVWPKFSPPLGEVESCEFCLSFEALCQKEGLWHECISGLPTILMWVFIFPVF